MRFVVAIDGPAASGKGTIAKAVAERFDLAHLDTGLLYRAVGQRALDQGRGVLDEGVAILVAKELKPSSLEASGLRGALAARAASRVATIPAVRSALVDFQRAFAERDGGAVLDGRDIGTVICPDADLKLYVTAGVESRAARRHAELVARGGSPSLEAVLHDLASRDARDSGRSTAPLAKADDAHLLDTTELSIDAAVARAAELIEPALMRARTL